MLLIYFIAATAVLFVAWVIMATFVLDHLRHYKEHSLPVRVIIFLLAGGFVLLIDVPYNIVFGTLYFREKPNKNDCGWTLSERLRRILLNERERTWRWKHGYFICRKFISPWDYNHCRVGLGRK